MFIKGSLSLNKPVLLIVFVFAIVMLWHITPAFTESKPQRILFIGNSYTSHIKNNFMFMLSKSAYKKTMVEYITRGGASLDQHISDKNILKRIQKGSWDYVVLQDQSQTPALPGKYEASFYRAVEMFSVAIKESGAEPVLYMTWGRRDGDSLNKNIFPDFETMQKKLSAAYETAAAINDIYIAPVGHAWSVVWKQDKQLWYDLYSPDGSHPSSKGSFLVSCIFFRLFFDDSLDSVRHERTLTKREENIIKRAVLSVSN